MSQDPVTDNASATRGDTSPGATPPAGERTKDPLRRSRTSAAWVVAVLLGFFLVLLIVFVVQNTQTAHINFLGWDGNAPQAVMLLIAAVIGLAITGSAGALRIVQLRHRVKHGR